MFNAKEKVSTCGEADGHLTISEMFERTNYQPDPEIMAVIRHPIDRAVSFINYTTNNTTLDERMEFIAKLHHSNLVSRKQSYYFDVDVPVKLFPFERIRDAISYIGGEYVHLNKVPHRWAHENIVLHPLWETVIKIYDEDWELYRRACNG